jgi:multiple sugar transport system substrate-binding protein
MKRFNGFRLTRAMSIIAVVAVLGAAMPWNGAVAQDEITISYFTFSAAPDHVEDLDAMVALFEEANPGITIDVETAAYADYFTELQTRIAGGDAPDTFELNYENFVTYASKGALKDLTDTLDAESAARFYPEALQAFQLDGVQYGLPASFSDVVLFYNKDLFDAAGLAYPTSDWTWAEEKAAAQALTDPDAGVWGQFAPISFFEFYKTAAQNGCSFFAEDGSVAIDQPACVEALQYMIDAQNEGLQPTDADLAGVSDGDTFLQGNIAMLTTGIWMFSAFADAPFNWDIAVEPGNTQKASHFFSNAAVVSSDTEQAEAATKWVTFLTSDPAAAQIRVDASWELPALQDEALFQDYLSLTPPDNREAVFESLDAIVTPPVIEQQQQMQDAVTAVLDQVKLGELTPQEALTKAKEDIEALLAS